jgi:hypothetical protein
MRLKAALPSGRLSAPIARRLERGTLIFAAIALALAATAAFVDTRRFAFAWLTGVLWVVTVGVGALVFLLIQHVVGAGWSSAARRQAEWVAGILPIGAVLFVPVALLAPRIYAWMAPDPADELLHKKAAWLNAPFFFVRAAIYFAVWSLLSWRFRRTSRAQDSSAEPAAETMKMQRWSAPSILVTGITLTFAAFDWIMSLDAHWYSTIFGVYIFAGSFVSALALLALLSLLLEGLGVYGPISTVEHRHDLGKLLFGFTVFWAYIGFCQYFLIWYAGIPEETVFFLRRWTGSWKLVSLALCVGHFVVPFVLLLGRSGKRNRWVLAIAALVILKMHWVDLYWLTMPTLDRAGATLSWIDVVGTLAPFAVLAVWLARRAAREPAYPLRDPRLPEAVRLENF